MRISPNTGHTDGHVGLCQGENDWRVHFPRGIWQTNEYYITTNPPAVALSQQVLDSEKWHAWNLTEKLWGRRRRGEGKTQDQN